MLDVYTTDYFKRHEKASLIRQLFIDRVDRKEPVFSFLKRKKSRKASLLDIGCGSGKFLSHAESYFTCTGIDISKAGLQEAKKITKTTKLIQRSVYDLDKFKGQKFDVVTCFDVLEHVVEIDRVLTGIKNLLTDDGIFVISSPNGNAISKELKWKKWFGFHDVTHLWFYAPVHWEWHLHQSGLVPMKRFYHGLMDPPYFAWLPNILQLILFKYVTQGLSLIGVPIPEKLGEVCFIVGVKNPGWSSDNFKLQKKLIK